MMKTLHTFIATALAVLSLTACSKARHEIIICGDNKIEIIDTALSTDSCNAVVWRWEASEAAGYLPEGFVGKLQTLDECKPIDGGRQILVCSSGGAALLLDRASGKPLFYAAVPMAHSAEMLPGGRIAVALSTHNKGNSIELYDSSRSNETLFRDSLYSGHGVVWMQANERLYALGFDQLRAYSLQDWNSSKPWLKMEKSWRIPDESGHDLARISPTELVITAHNGVHKFNTESETFSPFEPLATARQIKSVNYNPATGRLIYTKAEIDWWTHNVYGLNPEQRFKFNHIDVYKTRVVE